MVPKHHPFSTAESPVGRTASKMSFGDGCSTSRWGRQPDGEQRLLRVKAMFLGTNCICVGILSSFCSVNLVFRWDPLWLLAKIPCCITGSPHIFFLAESISICCRVDLHPSDRSFSVFNPISSTFYKRPSCQKNPPSMQGFPMFSPIFPICFPYFSPYVSPIFPLGNPNVPLGNPPFFPMFCRDKRPQCQALGRGALAVWPELRAAVQGEPQLVKAAESVGCEMWNGCKCVYYT